MSKKVLLALAVALALPSAAGAFSPSGAKGRGVLEPGCPVDALSAYVYCPSVPISFVLKADRTLRGTTGYLNSRWLVPGRTSTTFTGRVLCLNVVGNAMVLGGYLTNPRMLAGMPFVEYAVDNGLTGDLVSDLGFFPFDDPDLVLLPDTFPRVCPEPGLLASIYGYLPVQSGGIAVTAGSP